MSSILPYNPDRLYDSVVLRILNDFGGRGRGEQASSRVSHFGVLRFMLLRSGGLICAPLILITPLGPTRYGLTFGNTRTDILGGTIIINTAG